MKIWLIMLITFLVTCLGLACGFGMGMAVESQIYANKISTDNTPQLFELFGVSNFSKGDTMTYQAFTPKYGWVKVVKTIDENNITHVYIEYPVQQ